MKDYDINNVLDQIYDIDEKGIELKEKLKIVEDEFYQKLLEKLKDLERKYMKSARVEAKRKSKEILKKTIEDEQKIMEECYEETDRLDNILINHREDLIKKVFDHVFLEK